MLLDWLSWGYPEDLFWRSTVAQVALHFRAADMRRRREHNDRAWLAYHTAGFQRYKKLDRKALSDVQLADGSKSKRQSPGQQLDIIKALHAALGGTVH